MAARRSAAMTRQMTGRPSQRDAAKAEAAPSIAPDQVTTMPQNGPNNMPLATAMISAGTGTKEWSTMSAIEPTALHMPQAATKASTLAGVSSSEPGSTPMPLSIAQSSKTAMTTRPKAAASRAGCSAV